MRTNELQLLLHTKERRLWWCASCAPMNYNQCIPNVSQCCSGARRAHPRITTVLGTGAAGPIPVRSVRTNELQLPFFETKNEAYMGALHAHPRITTASPESLPGSCAGALHAHPRITTTRPPATAGKARFGALRAHPRITTARHATSLRRLPVRLVRTHELQQLCQCQKYHLGWCAPCAPTNYNDFAGLIQPIEAGAFCVHQ